MNLFKKLAIDLGTANSLVWEVGGRGLVINEPTVVAVTLEERKVLAVGNEAKEMLGRTPEYIEVVRPMRNGVIADYQVTEAMLRHFIRKVTGPAMFLKPEVMVCVPAGVTQVEQRAVLDAALNAGARVSYLIDSPLAAAIGAGIPISSAAGNMIVDIGGGACEAAIIALGGVVIHKSVRVAGNALDGAIIDWFRKKHNLVVGDQTAEQIKIEIGTALPLKKEKKMEIRGRDSISGLPREMEVSSNQINEAIQEPLNEILSTIRGVMEKTPPELIADIVDRGVILSGGTSLLNSLDKYLTRQIGVSFHVADEPLLSVVKGTASALENLENYKKSLKA